MPRPADRWLMLCVLFVARTAMAYQFQTVASAGPFLLDALDIDFAALGTLIGLYMLPGVVFALPGGVLGQRFGAKRVALLGLGVMALGGTLMAADGVVAAAAGRLISGVGAVLINVLLTKMIADWFAGREIVAAMAVLIASWPLGLALGLISFPLIAATAGWAAVMHAGALAALACLTLVAWLYRDPPGAAAGPGAGLRIDLTRREWLLVGSAGLIWGTYNAGYIVLISFLPELFTVRGYSLSEASQMVSLLAWVSIPSVPLAGVLAERLDRPNLLMIGNLAIVAIAIAVLPFASATHLVFAVVVLVIGLPAGLLMALPTEALRLENRAAGMGVFYTLHYVSLATLPPLAGMARDLSASPAAPPLFAAGLIVAAALILVAFRVAQRPPALAPARKR